jgi:hypothetical protein
MFTSIKRVTGGGWRISAPNRQELGISKSAKGYYPASIEFGFDHYKSGEHWDGDESFKEVMEMFRRNAINVARNFILIKLEAMMKRHMKAKLRKAKK